MRDLEKLQEYDKNKTKVLKYVLYKKRSESEVRRKFEDTMSTNMLEDILEELKQNSYINDEDYVERAVSEFVALQNISLKQIKYKLLSKGISSNIVEDYFYNNRAELQEYEKNSIEKIIAKKSDSSKDEIISFLLKKGFEYDNVREKLEQWPT